MCSSSIAPFYQFRTVCAILLLMLCLSAAAAKSLDEYPNPFDDTYRQCNLAEQVEFLRDPDRVLNDEDRGKLAKLLREFPATTRSINGNLWCKWNGLRIAIATANTSYGFGHFDAAEKLLKRWGIDNFCRNAVLFFFDAELREIFHAQYSRSNARVFAYEIDGLITKQRQKLRDGKIFEAFRALLEGIRKIVIYRQNNPFPFPNNELEEEGSGETAEEENESAAQYNAWVNASIWALHQSGQQLAEEIGRREHEHGQTLEGHRLLVRTAVLLAAFSGLMSLALAAAHCWRRYRTTRMSVDLPLVHFHKRSSG